MRLTKPAVIAIDRAKVTCPMCSRATTRRDLTELAGCVFCDALFCGNDGCQCICADAVNKAALEQFILQLKLAQATIARRKRIKAEISKG